MDNLKIMVGISTDSEQSCFTDPPGTSYYHDFNLLRQWLLHASNYLYPIFGVDLQRNYDSRLKLQPMLIHRME